MGKQLISMGSPSRTRQYGVKRRSRTDCARASSSVQTRSASSGETRPSVSPQARKAISRASRGDRPKYCSKRNFSIRCPGAADAHFSRKPVSFSSVTGRRVPAAGGR